MRFVDECGPDGVIKKANAWLKAALMRALVRHSDVIITHAREGVDYARQIDRRAEDKTHFVHHPVEAF